MYKFLLKHFSKGVANFMIALWYLVLLILNVYCGISASQGAFQYVGW